MTKGELIESVLIAVTGGMLTSESNVWREDIRTYVPAAIREAVKGYIYELKAQNRADQFKSKGIDEGLLTTVTRTPIKDAERNLWYVQLPQVMPLPNGWGLASVLPQKSGAVQYANVPSQASLTGTGDFLPTAVWLEADSSRVYFTDMSLPVCPVIVRAAIDVTALADDEQSPVYSMVEGRVIEMCRQFFMAQRLGASDGLLDNQDLPK